MWQLLLLLVHQVAETGGCIERERRNKISLEREREREREKISREREGGWRRKSFGETE